MKKFLGLVKKYDERMSGAEVRIISKTYDDVETMNEWFAMYPDCCHILLNNTEELDSMFE